MNSFQDKLNSVLIRLQDSSIDIEKSYHSNEINLVEAGKKVAEEFNKAKAAITALVETEIVGVPVEGHILDELCCDTCDLRIQQRQLLRGDKLNE